MTDYEQSSQPLKEEFLIYEHVNPKTRQALEQINDDTRIPDLFEQLNKKIPDMLYPRPQRPYPTYPQKLLEIDTVGPIDDAEEATTITEQDLREVWPLNGSAIKSWQRLVKVALTSSEVNIDHIGPIKGAEALRMKIGEVLEWSRSKTDQTYSPKQSVLSIILQRLKDKRSAPNQQDPSINQTDLA